MESKHAELHDRRHAETGRSRRGPRQERHGSARDESGRLDALAPVELLLAAVAAAVLGGTEHAVVALHFRLLDATVSVRGRHEGAARALAIEYDLLLATDEPDARLLQFHEVVRRSDSVQRRGAVDRELTGSLRRQLA
jgi:uncharacterized OsmC-like protein